MLPMGPMISGVIKWDPFLGESKLIQMYGTVNLGGFPI